MKNFPYKGDIDSCATACCTTVIEVINNSSASLFHCITRFIFVTGKVFMNLTLTKQDDIFRVL